jgi:hypothetical protein
VWKLRDAFNYIKAGLWPSPLGYQVNNSLRFNSGSSDSLTKTTTTPDNRDKLTLSAWFKLSSGSTSQEIFGFYGSNDYFTVRASNADQIDVILYDNTTLARLITTQLLRDFSAWYHIVVVVDSANATADDRIKIYLNGNQITSFSSRTNPSQNQDFILTTLTTTGVGINTDQVGGVSRFNGYIAEAIYVDNQALTPSSFGETDTATGIWIPKAYTGTYGTAGFELEFKNSAALGTDTSGNGNNFTVNNLTSVDQSTDTPTNNFAIINSLDAVTKTLTDGNLTLSASNKTPRGTFGLSTGKWYWECKLITQISSTQIIGICNESFVLTNDLGVDSNGWGYIIQSNANNGQAYHNSTVIQYATFTTNDILNIALDMDNKAIYFGKNGTYQNSGVPTSGASKTGAIYTNLPTSGLIFPAFVSSSTGVISVNFGNPPYSVTSGYTDAGGFGNFSYQPPSGYYSLCTRTLAALG